MTKLSRAAIKDAFPFGLRPSYPRERGVGSVITHPLLDFFYHTDFRLSQKALDSAPLPCTIPMQSLAVMSRAFVRLRDETFNRRETRSVLDFLNMTQGSCVFQPCCEFFRRESDGHLDKKTEYAEGYVFVGSVHPLQKVLAEAKLFRKDYTKKAYAALKDTLGYGSEKGSFPTIRAFADHPVALTVDGGMHVLQEGDRVVDTGFRLKYKLERIDDLVVVTHHFHDIDKRGSGGQGLSMVTEGWELAPLRRAGWPHAPLIRDISKPLPAWATPKRG